MHTTLKLYINDELKTFNHLLLKETPPTIEDLTLELNLNSTHGIAIAINDTVVPRSLWSTTHLNDNDQILLIQATQGG